MNLKNITLLTLATVLIFSKNIDCQEDELEDFIKSEYAGSEYGDLDLEDGLQNIEINDLKTRAIPCQATTNKDILNCLNLINLPAILSHDLYEKTYPLNMRPINSLPIFNIYHTEYLCQDWVLKFNLFGNSTPRQFFTKNSDKISSYINLNDPDLLADIEDAQNIANVNIPKILSLFQNGRVEQRRLGLMTQFLKNFKDSSLEIDIPLLYGENNFFLTEQEQIDIENTFVQMGVAFTRSQGEEMLKKLVVADKVGLGDSRVKFGAVTIENDCSCIKLGFLATIPTAFAFKKGLVGSSFKNNFNVPNVNLQNIAVLLFEARNGDQEAIKQLRIIGSNFGLSSLKQLSAMLLDTPLGNGGHFGLGMFVEPKFRINEGFTLRLYGTFEYLFPATELRYFLKKKNCNDFNPENFNTDVLSEAQAGEAIQFLSQQLVNTLFPSAINVSVDPGLSFEFTICPLFTLREWDFMFGYDFWFQQQETLGHLSTVAPDLFDIQKCIRPHAMQNKFFAKVDYNVLNKNYSWVVSLSAERAFATSGIGEDFTVSASFDLIF